MGLVRRRERIDGRPGMTADQPTRTDLGATDLGATDLGATDLGATVELLARRLAEVEHRLQETEDQLAILRVMASYGPAVDGLEAEVAADLWAPGGVYHSSGAGTWEGPGSIAAMLRGEGHGGLVAAGCAHTLDLPKVTVDGDRAVALCHGVLYVRSGDDGFRAWRVTASRWDFVRGDRGWRVTHRVNQVLDGSGAGPALFAAAVREEIGEAGQARG
jgi:hypothetical protein